MRLLILALLIVAPACARRPESLPDQIQAVGIDTTGADVTRFDSLPRDYLTPPGPVDTTSMWMPIPPMPIPRSIRGSRVEVVFTVGPDGRVTRLSLIPPTDRRYARELIESWRSLKFRPARRADGTPTIGYYKLRFDF